MLRLFMQIRDRSALWAGWEVNLWSCARTGLKIGHSLSGKVCIIIFLKCLEYGMREVRVYSC